MFQESAGVKMIMIQDSQEAGHGPKPLRIIGDPEKVEHAKRLVEDIINSRDDNPPTQQRFSNYGSPMSMGGGGGMGGGPKSIGEVCICYFVQLEKVLIVTVICIIFIHDTERWHFR